MVEERRLEGLAFYFTACDDVFRGVSNGWVGGFDRRRGLFFFAAILFTAVEDNCYQAIGFQLRRRGGS